MGQTINQKVAIWTQGQIGKTVGAGECWDLGESALKQAGAQTSNDLGPVGDDTDYVWGDPIDIKDVKAGDIIQFRDHEVTTTTVVESKFADGSTDSETMTATAERPHHTAIANGKIDANGVLQVLEQQHDEVVHKSKLETRDIAAVSKKSTTKRVNPQTQKLETATVNTTVTITTTGTMWVYHPKPK